MPFSANPVRGIAGLGSLQNFFDLLLDLAWRKRLVHTLPPALNDDLRMGESRHENDLKRGPFLCQFRSEFRASHPRHRNIRKQQVDVAGMLLRHFERLLTVMCDQCSVAPTVQKLLKKTPEYRL